MSSPRAVARSLKQTATRLQRVTDDTVRETAEAAISEAIHLGGSFGRRTLLGYVSEQSNRGGSSSVVVRGRPAGAWTIKSYGRRGGYEVRPRRAGKRVLDLRRAGTGSTAAASAVVHTATRGDDRWNRVRRAAGADAVTILARNVEAAVRG